MSSEKLNALGEAMFLMEGHEKEDDNFKTLVSNNQVLSCVAIRELPPLKSFSMLEMEKIFHQAETGAIPEDVRTLMNLQAHGRNLENYIPGAGKVIFDLLYQLKAPGDLAILFGLEAQQCANPGYPLYVRADFYAARIIALEKNWIFDGSNYRLMEPLWDVWIVAGNSGDPYTDIIYQEHHLTVDDKENPGKTKKVISYINIVMLYLGREDVETNIDTLKMLRALLYANKPLAERFQILESFGIQVTEEMKEAMQEMETMWTNLAMQSEAKGVAKGEAVGFAKGEAVGFAKGKTGEAKKIARRLLNTGMNIEDVQEITELPVEELKKLYS